MVRKRTRKYNSDDNDSDSDLDFDINHATQEPAPKKYSLRERKRAPLFTNDFDYYGLDEDDEFKKESSDDEDFEVKASQDSNKNLEVASAPHNPEGLIDFEDIIRADIVVNRNKIDYDNVIQKTEIKLTQPKKRGRKPKISVKPTDQQETTKNSNTACQHDIQTLTSVEEEKKEDTNVLEPEINFCEKQVLSNNDKIENISNQDTLISNETNPLVTKKSINTETVALKPPPVHDVNDLKEDNIKIINEEDDDVIVLGELKEDVIVLDD